MLLNVITMLLCLANKVQGLLQGTLTRLFDTAASLFFVVFPARQQISLAMAANDLPDNILALRTITTFLAGIPRTNDIQSYNNFDAGTWGRYEFREELKALDAFALLLVTKHEVTSVVSNRSKMLRVMTASSSDNQTGDEDEAISLEHSSSSDEDTLGERVARVLTWPYYAIMATMNDRRDDKSTRSRNPGPELVGPRKPDDLGDKDVKSYMLDLEKSW